MMENGKDIKLLADRVFAPDPINLPAHELRGVPGNIQRIMDETLASTGKKIWHGMVQAAASGFGKGVLIMAVLIVGASALGGAASALTVADLTFNQGLLAGAIKGLGSLFVAGGGPVLLGIGGLLGGAMDIRHRQNQISADTARAEAAAYQAIREQRLSQQKNIDYTESMPDVSFTEREMAKRETTQQHSLRK